MRLCIRLPCLLSWNRRLLCDKRRRQGKGRVTYFNSKSGLENDLQRDGGDVK